MAEAPPTNVLTFVVRAYPTKAQHARFVDYLRHTRHLYNAALEERIDCYRKTRRTISNAEKSRGLTELRQSDPAYAAYPRRLQRWAINLVEAAYKGMFARHRKGERGRQIGFRVSVAACSGKPSGGIADPVHQPGQNSSRTSLPAIHICAWRMWS